MKLAPTVIKLHQKSRFLEIAFSDGSSFNYPCEYLRVYSPSADVKGVDKPVDGKSQVNITEIEPQGGYAICLTFDDGHDSGIYSWTTLHELGLNYEKNWVAYLDKLAEYNLDRGDKGAGLFVEVKSITLLYLMALSDVSGAGKEVVTLPTSITNVASLLEWLRGKGESWQEVFADDQVQVSINKQLVALQTVIDSGDEVAIMPLDVEKT